MTNGDNLARRNNSTSNLRQSGSQHQSLSSGNNHNMIPSQGLRKRDSSSSKDPAVARIRSVTGQNRNWIRQTFSLLRRIFARHKHSRPMIVVALLLFVNLLLFVQLKRKHMPKKVDSSSSNVDGSIMGQLPKTTIVLMGYTMARIDNYERILPAYGAMDKALDRVIFLWNSKFL